MGKTAELTAFAARLNLVCTNQGMPEHGRQTALAKLLQISQKGAAKWLNGDGWPNKEKILRIAAWAKIRAAWLEYGEEPMFAEPHEKDEQMLSALKNPKIRAAVLLLSDMPDVALDASLKHLVDTEKLVADLTDTAPEKNGTNG